MNKPNFFILGAPKCGTTTLDYWLAQHPNIYMAPVKECHHFSTDISTNIEWKDFDFYSTLFNAVEPKHKAIGEASVWYLRSREAVMNIESKIPKARYIVMLRNPVLMAPSLHGEHLYCGYEDIDSFERAWEIDKEREVEKKIPTCCPDPKLVQYRRSCELGKQLARLYELVERERVLTIFLEDMEENPSREWGRVLEFLNVPYWDDFDFPVRNPAKRWRWLWVRDLLSLYSRLAEGIHMPPLGLGIIKKIQDFVTVEKKRPQITKGLQRALVETFSEDIDLLSQLTNRDLSHWKKV